MRRFYKNPPVIETLCEFAFMESEWNPTLPGLFFERVRDKYPTLEPVSQIGFEFQVAAGEVSTKTNKLDDAVRFANEGRTQLIQIGKNSLTVHRLKPYPGYKEWRLVVDDALSMYIDVVKPLACERIGLRYINEIVIPLGTFALESYFAFSPRLPENMGVGIRKFFTTVEIQTIHPSEKQIIHPSQQMTAAIGTGASQGEGKTAIFLDLYATQPVQNLIALEGLLSKVDEAHQSIGAVFETIITKSTRELFGEEVDQDDHSNDT